MPIRRPRREEIAAAILAPVVVLGAVFAGLHRDTSSNASSEPTPVDLDAPIPVDVRLRTGKLRNELQYFVQRNHWPEKRAELRLVVNAGSVLEADDQRGLAHAVEHMLFRGTKRFPRHFVDNYLMSIGMRRGSDINASTSEDETIYRITVPTERLGAIDTALAILADMAHNAVFDANEAQQEGGVVLSEWRSRSSARQRLYDDRNALLLSGSPYAGHPVIGDTAVLHRFDLAAMKRFYADWYRPDLMAVVAVGDFEAPAVEELVKKHFGDVPKARSPRARSDAIVPRPPEPRAAVLHDPEATESRISLWFPRRPTPRKRLADHRAALVDAIWRSALSDRLDDASERAASPILNASVVLSNVVRPLEADVITLDIAPHREQEALDLVATEIARLAQHGIAASDLKRRTALMLRERRAAEERADESVALAEGLADTFLAGNALVTLESRYELARDLLPTIRTEDVLARAREASLDRSVSIILTAPTNGATRSTPSELIARARSAGARSVEMVRDTTDQVPLVPVLPTPGRVESERTVAGVSAFDWTLSNGMRVILKPTRFLYDDIELRVVGPGGASLARDEDYPSAYLADRVIGSTGIGPLNGTRLARRLDGTSIELEISVDNDAIGMNGSAAPRDLETFLQLIHLYFTAPRADTVAFRRYYERSTSYARGRESNPDAQFSDSVAAIVSQHHARALPVERRRIGEVRLSKALEFWTARAANAAGFTVVLTGDFTLDRVRPLVVRYLASLTAGTAEKPRDVGLRFPSGITRRRLVAGMAPRARTQLVFSGPYNGSNEMTDDLGAVADVLELALTDRLRERLGGTYGARVSSSVNLVPPATYMMTVDFETAPERTDSLVTAALEEIDRLRTRGPNDDEVAKTREARKRDRDGDLESNNYWANELSWHARMGWPLATIADHQNDVLRMSKANLQAAARAYLKTSDYVEVTMMPKGKATP